MKIPLDETICLTYKELFHIINNSLHELTQDDRDECEVIAFTKITDLYIEKNKFNDINL